MNADRKILTSIPFLMTAGVLLLVSMFSNLALAADILVYKSPTCGCCKAWVKHIRDQGFSVEVHNRSDMNPIKQQYGIPGHLQSCHTAKAGDYVIEGHVPADLIARLLEEKPRVQGLAVPGMPMGSPGMEGPRKDDYYIFTFKKNGKTKIYDKR